MKRLFDPEVKRKTTAAETAGDAYPVTKPVVAAFES